MTIGISAVSGGKISVQKGIGTSGPHQSLVSDVAPICDVYVLIQERGERLPAQPTNNDIVILEKAMDEEREEYNKLKEKYKDIDFMLK